MTQGRVTRGIRGRWLKRPAATGALTDARPGVLVAGTGCSTGEALIGASHRLPWRRSWHHVLRQRRRSIADATAVGTAVTTAGPRCSTGRRGVPSARRRTRRSTLGRSSPAFWSVLHCLRSNAWRGVRIVKGLERLTPVGRRRPSRGRDERAPGRVESCAVLRDEHHLPRRELGEQPAVEREKAREAHRGLQGIIEKGDDQTVRAGHVPRDCPWDRRRRSLPQARRHRAMPVIALLGGRSTPRASELRAPRRRSPDTETAGGRARSPGPSGAVIAAAGRGRRRYASAPTPAAAEPARRQMPYVLRATECAAWHPFRRSSVRAKAAVSMPRARIGRRNTGASRAYPPWQATSRRKSAPVAYSRARRQGRGVCRSVVRERISGKAAILQGR